MWQLGKDQRAERFELALAHGARCHPEDRPLLELVNALRAMSLPASDGNRGRDLLRGVVAAQRAELRSEGFGHKARGAAVGAAAAAGAGLVIAGAAGGSNPLQVIQEKFDKGAIVVPSADPATATLEGRGYVEHTSEIAGTAQIDNKPLAEIAHHHAIRAESEVRHEHGAEGAAALDAETRTSADASAGAGKKDQASAGAGATINADGQASVTVDAQSKDKGGEGASSVSAEITGARETSASVQVDGSSEATSTIESDVGSSVETSVDAGLSSDGAISTDTKSTTVEGGRGRFSDRGEQC